MCLTFVPVTVKYILHDQQGNEMTKKDFEMLAKHLRSMMNVDQRLAAAVAVASAAAELNPRFDAQRFFAAANCVQQG